MANAIYGKRNILDLAQQAPLDYAKIPMRDAVGCDQDGVVSQWLHGPKATCGAAESCVIPAVSLDGTGAATVAIAEHAAHIILADA
ncbi:hypothetical protein ACS3SW_11810 [Roseobacteraceae bacterium S113]